MHQFMKRLDEVNSNGSIISQGKDLKLFDFGGWIYICIVVRMYIMVENALDDLTLNITFKWWWGIYGIIFNFQLGQN